MPEKKLSIRKQRKLVKKQKKLDKKQEKLAKKQLRSVKKQKKLAKKQSLLMPRYFNGLSYDELMDLESKWGAMIFGPVPAGCQRAFFEHKKNVWILYESWKKDSSAPQEMIIRYEVRPAGVFKRVNGQKYEKLAGAELDNFRTAAKNYLKLIRTKLYY